MTFIYFLAAFYFCVTGLYAQQNHFIYIQTENKQPFYVRLSDKVLSSSSSGYIVISKLQNGDHDLLIGFPKNEWPQQKISVKVRNNDAGYILKNFDTKGWGLFNLQTMEVVMSVTNQSKSEPVTTIQSDGFADVLSDVVNNPAIKQKPVVKETGKVKEPEKSLAEVKNEPVPVKNVETTVKEAKKEKVESKSVLKILSILEADGRSMVYVDTDYGKADTVRIFIPYKKIEMQVKDTAIKIIKEAVNAPIVKEVQEIKETKMEDQALVKKDMPEKEMPDSTLLKKDTVVNELLVEKRKDPVKDLDANIENPEKKPVLMINSDCKSMATDEDFLKLRKKMAAQKSDENMIVIARKTFVSKCFSTEQVKNLSSLFLKDEGCYNFFDAAYPHVNDTQNFQTLVSRLTDEYYINRFKAMIRH